MEMLPGVYDSFSGNESANSCNESTATQNAGRNLPHLWSSMIYLIFSFHLQKDLFQRNGQYFVVAKRPHALGKVSELVRHKSRSQADGLSAQDVGLPCAKYDLFTLVES